jgi:hypothetical protein
VNIDEIPCLVDYETREDCIDYGALKLEDGMVAVELGSYLGGSIARLASKIKERNINCKIYAIDNWKCDNISRASLNWSNLSEHTDIFPKYQFYMKELGLDTIITTIISDTIKAAEQFADRSINYIFFDASHGYDGVIEELKVWIPKFHNRCFAFIHDFPDMAIQQAVYDTCGIQRVVRGGSSAVIKDTL